MATALGAGGATPPKLFVATPTTNGVMLSGYVASVLSMVTRLHAQGVGTEYRTIDGPNLVMQRDMLAHAFLESACTHLLFIDSDMAFEPRLCEKLLAARKPLVGTIYAKRALDLAKVKALAPTHGFDHALALAYEWNVPLLGRELTVTKDLCKVEGIGFGFALIERACFAELAESCPLYEAPLGRTKLRAFFREMPVGDGAILDLDYSFCRRWADRGGEVWASVTADIRHIGDFAYGVPFSLYLNALRAPSRGSDAAQPAAESGGTG